MSSNEPEKVVSEMQQLHDEKVRRELSKMMRLTIKDMATTAQNALGLTEAQAFRYVINEAEYVQEYYAQQREKKSDG